MQVQCRSCKYYVLLITLLIAAISISCGGSNTKLLPAVARQSADFELVVTDDEILGRQTGVFALNVSEAGNEVVVGVRVSGARDLKAAYFELRYDPERFDPIAIEATGALEPAVDANAGAEPLALQYLNEPGCVYYGQVLPQALECEGFSGDAIIAEARFARCAFAPRAASAPPQTEASAVSLDWNVEARLLSWGYSCQGDYNQDGMVTVNDLTPLGVHFLAEGPFDEHSALAVIDGNGDGMITVSDITPIGQNFNCGIDGYLVFASENPEEVPGKEVSEVLELDFIPLAAAQGDKITERLWFNQEYPEVEPHLILWVSPLDDDQVGVPSWPQMPGLAMWQLHNVSSFADRQGGLANDVAIVGAMPVVAYADHYNDKLCYQRATLVDGSAWDDEVVVESNAACSFVSLAVVNGHPAIAYADLNAGQMKYVRATNQQGTAWGTPVVIDDETSMSSGTPLYYPELLVINGYPAIGYLDYYEREIRYRGALDVDGNSWDSIVTAATFQTPVTPEDTGASFALIGGYPAAVYSDDQGTAVMFTRANNADGSSWGTPVTVDGLADAGSFMSLFEVDGRPAAAYRAGTTMRYSIANDSGGSAWGSPALAAGSIGSGAHLAPSLHVNNGKPAIAYYHQDSQTLRGFLGYVAALDAYGGKWAAPLVIDGSDTGIDCGYCPNLINVGVNPAVSYCNVTAGEMWFAECIDIFNQLPLAEIAPSSSESKIGYEIEFDASASHDPDGEIVLYEWDWNGDNTFDQDSGTDPVASHIYEELGVYTPHVRVSDNRGGTARGWTTVEILENVRPVAHLEINPTSGAAPFTVNFDASGSYDDDGTIVMYEWDWDGDGSFEHETGNSPYWSWIYEHEGELYPAVKVTDNDGGIATAMVCCTGNKSPVAIGSATPSSGTAPFDVKLTCSNSFDPDGNITKIWWDVHDDGVVEYTANNLNTWTCRMLWSGAVKVRLRVQDNDGAFGSTVVTVNVTKGWHVATVDSAGDVGSYCSLALINGRPAISYFDGTNGYLKYVRASDAVGYSWPTSMSVVQISDGVAYGYYACSGTSLAWINGSRPAIAFRGDIFTWPGWMEGYILANDANGTTWGSIGSLPQGTNSQPSLCVVASNPAVASISSDTNYCRASSPTGSTWNAQQTVDTSTGPYGCQMILVDGKPAIVYSHSVGTYPSNTEQISYVRAGDATGDSWGTPIRLDTGNSYTDDVTIAIINGRPAVAYVVEDPTNGWELRYMRANNTTGSSWPTSGKVIASDTRLSCSIVEIAGRPAIAYLPCGTMDLTFVRAADASGSANWLQPMIVDNTDEHVGTGMASCRMIAINDKPAIVYHHEKNQDLKYAVWE